MSTIKQIPINWTFLLTLNFRQCIIGEEESNQQCRVCDDNYYSMGKSKCLKCPQNGVCKNGLIQSIESGFWRQQFQSSFIFQCFNRPSNCKEDSLEEKHCVDGYIGPLCETCDYYGVNNNIYYSKQDDYVCIQCNKNNQNIIKSVFYYIFYSFSLLTLTYISFQGVQSMLVVEYLRYQGIFSFGLSGLVQLSGIYLKILLNHIQMLLVFSSINYQYKSEIWQLLNYRVYAKQLMSIDVYNFDCLYHNIVLNDDKFPFRILVLKLFLIFSSFTVICLVYFFLIQFYQKIKLSTNKIKFIIIYLYLFYCPEFSDRIFSRISCQNVGDQSYFAIYMLLNCFTKQHFINFFSIAIPMFILLVIFPSIVIFIKIKSKQIFLKQGFYPVQTTIIYGISFYEYRGIRYYFEIIKIYQKVLMLFVINFLISFGTIKLGIQMLIIILYGIIQTQIKPYFRISVQSLDKMSNQFVNQALIIGIILIQNNSYEMTIFLLLITFALNFIFCGKVIYLLLSQQFYENRINIQEYLSKFNIHCFKTNGFQVFRRWMHLKKKLKNKEFNKQHHKKLLLNESFLDSND